MTASPITAIHPAMRLMTVDPTMAAKWLERNSRNRPMSQSRVKLYARSMADGLWRHPTGETIIFNSLGELQDGQHRLAAQVASGATITYWVMTDADPEDFLVLNRGRSRRPGDIVAIHGIASGNQVASIGRLVLDVKRYSDKVWSGVMAHPDEVTRFCIDNAEALSESVAAARAAFTEAKMPHGQYGAVHYLVNEQMPGSAQWQSFHDAVKSGSLLAPDSPVLTLRRWSIARTQWSKGRAQQAVVYITKAWNAYAEGKPLKQLKWTSSELPMPYPKAPNY